MRREGTCVLGHPARNNTCILQCMRYTAGHGLGRGVHRHRRRLASRLVGGDKTNDWDGWYRRNIKLADRLYDDHLAALAER